MNDELMQEEDEQVDIVSLLAMSGEDEDVDIDDEELESMGSDDDLPTDVEALQAALLKEREIKKKRNFALKKAQKANKRIKGEEDRMASRIEALEAKLNSSSNQSESDTESQKLAQVEQDWQDRIADDPTLTPAYMDWKMGNFQQGVTSYLTRLHESMTQQITDLKGSTDPERMKYQDSINKLKSNPQFESLDDEVLLTIVKASKANKVPRGGIGGGRVVQSAKPTDPNDRVLTDEEAQLMGFAD